MQRQATTTSSGSGSDCDPRYANIDEKKRKRMISNRESARRSRQKKQKQMEDLINEASLLQKENGHLKQSINVNSQRFAEVESANNVLRAQAMELTERLESLNLVLQHLEDYSGFVMEVPEIADPWLRPYQLPYPIQPIMASANAFEY